MFHEAVTASGKTPCARRASLLQSQQMHVRTLTGALSALHHVSIRLTGEKVPKVSKLKLIPLRDWILPIRFWDFEERGSILSIKNCFKSLWILDQVT